MNGMIWLRVERDLKKIELGFLNRSNGPTDEARDALSLYQLIWSVLQSSEDVLNKTVVIFHNESMFIIRQPVGEPRILSEV